MKSLLLLVSFISLAMFGCKPNCSDVKSADIAESCGSTADCMQGLRCQNDYDGLGRRLNDSAICQVGGVSNPKMCANKRLSAYGDACRLTADCANKVRCFNGRCFDGRRIPVIPDSAFVVPNCRMLTKRAVHTMDPALGPLLADKDSKKTPYTHDHKIAYQNVYHYCSVAAKPDWLVADRLCLYKAKDRKAILACGKPGRTLVKAYDHAFKGRGAK